LPTAGAAESATAATPAAALTRPEAVVMSALALVVAGAAPVGAVTFEVFSMSTACMAFVMDVLVHHFRLLSLHAYIITHMSRERGVAGS
jgi:hypothetical protein